MQTNQVYGAEKVWSQLHREDLQVAWCTVEGLMRQLDCVGGKSGPPGRTRQRPARTTWRGATLRLRPPTGSGWRGGPIVASWSGLVYVALVIDVFSRYIVGWRV